MPTRLAIRKESQREWAALKAWIAANLEIVVKATVPSAAPGRIDSGPVIARGVTEAYFGKSGEEFATGIIGQMGLPGGAGLTGTLLGMTKISKGAAKPTLKAAFKLKNGKVIDTGAIHILPHPLTTADIAESGFIDVATGKFFTREEAKALVGAGASEKIFPKAEYEASAKAAQDKDALRRAMQGLGRESEDVVVGRQGREYGVEPWVQPAGVPVFPGGNPVEGLKKCAPEELEKYLNNPNIKGQLRRMVQQEMAQRKGAQAVPGAMSTKEFASRLDNAYANVRNKAFLSEAEFESIANDLENAYRAGIINRNQFVDYTREFQSYMREAPLPEPTSKTARVYDTQKKAIGAEAQGIFDPAATASRYGKEISEREFQDIVNSISAARRSGMSKEKAAEIIRFWQQRTRFTKRLKPGEKTDPFGRILKPIDESKMPPTIEAESVENLVKDLEEWQLSKFGTKKEWQKAQRTSRPDSRRDAYIAQLAIGGAALAGYGIYKGGEYLKKFITNLLINYMNTTIGMGEVNWAIDPEDKSVPDQPRQEKEESYPGDQSFERLMRRAQVSAAQLSPTISALQRREDDSEDDEDYSEAILETAYMTTGQIGISAAKSIQNTISALRLGRISSAKLNNEARAALNRQSRLAMAEARRGAREHDKVIRTVAREHQKVETTQRQAGQYLGGRVGRILFEILDGQKEPFGKAWHLIGAKFTSAFVAGVYGAFEKVGIDFIMKITGLEKMFDKISKGLETLLGDWFGIDFSGGADWCEAPGASVPFHQGKPPGSMSPASQGASQSLKASVSDPSQPVSIKVILPEHLCLDRQALAGNLALSMQRYAHRWN